MTGFSKKRIVEITGLLPRQVQLLTEEGLIVPAEDRGQGRGKVRRYSANNLADFYLARELLNYGMSFKKLAFVFRYLHNLNPFIYTTNQMYLRIFSMSDGNLLADYDTEMKNRPLLHRAEMQDVNSLILIDFGRFIAKANMEV